MANYTTQVRSICEVYSGLNESVGYAKVSDVIEKAIPKVFDFDFPIFDEGYRKVLCTKILKHFYTREIGLETVGLWKLKLDTKLNEIMPIYNKMYEAVMLKFNPLLSITREHTLDRDSKTDGTSNTKTDMNDVSWNLYSDTPQGKLSYIDNNTYLTNATKNTDDNKSNTDNKYEDLATSTDEFLEHIYGVHGHSQMIMVKEYCENLINVDILILDELEELFFQLW